MSVTPFEPIGETARWRILYDMLRDREVDDVLTYKEMGEALELDPEADRSRIQMAFRRSAIQLERDDNRAVDVIQNVGYRIVPAPEHLRLARRHQRRSRKELDRGASKVTHVDLSGVDAETRKAFQVVAAAFSMQQEMLRRMDVKHDRLTKVVEQESEARRESQERTDVEVAELRARLEKLERQRADAPELPL